MSKPVIGVLGFSDGDKAAHEMLKPIVQAQVDAITNALRADGRVEVVVAEDIVHSDKTAKSYAEDLKAKGVDATIFAYGVFAFPSGDDNRMSAFAEMTQFNANLSDEELDACVKFMDYYQSDENVAEYGEYYNVPLPVQGAEAPAEQVNVNGMLETSNENGTFTITDQAFPTEVADVLFNAQDAVANGEMTPEDAAANIQKAIEEYQAK